MKTIIAFLIAFCTTGIATAQLNAVYLDEDKEIFNEYLTYISDYSLQSAEKILEKSALFFIDKPYVEHTLETEGEEVLVVNLREFDCTTFVETVIALTLAIRSNEPSFNSFIEKLQQIRYRDGRVDCYSSRIHYMSDWVYNNEERGILKNISLEIGGVIEDKEIDFMSTHRNAYQQLKWDDKNLNEIENIENEINSRDGFSYLPKANIEIASPMIPHMSIVAFSTSIDGLDVSHTGFAFHKEGELTFIHASSALNKVVIDTNKLSDYCNNQSRCTGIIVAELL